MMDGKSLAYRRLILSVIFIVAIQYDFHVEFLFGVLDVLNSKVLSWL